VSLLTIAFTDALLAGIVWMIDHDAKRSGD
jgi:hypothetical protein